MAGQGDKLVQVEIYGQFYTLRSEGDSPYVGDLANYVDTKMKEVTRHSAVVDSLKVAILAALNIADEYHQLKREVEKQRLDLAVRTAEWERMLDGAIGR